MSRGSVNGKGGEICVCGYGGESRREPAHVVVVERYESIDNVVCRSGGFRVDVGDDILFSSEIGKGGVYDVGMSGSVILKSQCNEKLSALVNQCGFLHFGSFYFFCFLIISC